MTGEWKDIENFYLSLYYNAASFVYEHQFGFLVTVIEVVILATVLLILLEWRKERTQRLLNTYVPQRRGKMLKKARERFVDAITADGFTSFMEDLVYRGTITRKECNERYRKLGAWLGNRDLLPSNHLLKEAINKRLQAKILYAKVDFPGAKPAEGMKIDKTYKPKSAFGDKARRR
jgi:hypothetical protein